MILAIVGPTASGKTSLAIKLARKLNAEIISFDSLQVYKYLNIGTAKPSPRELRLAKHHLLSIRYPDEEFNAGTFVKLAQDRIAKLAKQKRNVILVGGTGLYLKALLEGLCPAPPQDQQLRRQLAAQAKKYGNQYLYRQLIRVDPETAKKTHPHNLPRIIRALEVFQLTGQPITAFHGQTVKPAFHAKIIGLSWPRPLLYRRINQRVEDMFAQGLVKEAKAILRRGYKPELKPLQSLGYRQVYQYLVGKITLPRAIELTQRDTRHYAKRQLSWFRRVNGVKWFALKKDIDNKTLRKIIKFAKI